MHAETTSSPYPAKKSLFGIRTNGHVSGTQCHLGHIKSRYRQTGATLDARVMTVLCKLMISRPESSPHIHSRDIRVASQDSHSQTMVSSQRPRAPTTRYEYGVRTRGIWSPPSPSFIVQTMVSVTHNGQACLFARLHLRWRRWVQIQSYGSGISKGLHLTSM